MGIADKIIRIAFAILIGVLYFTGHINGTIAIILLAVAGVFLLTSFIDTCPWYLPFGLSSKKQ